MVRVPLTVAVAQPVCVSRDVAANVLAHADAVRQGQCRVVVFPELSLTGYELEAPVLDPGDCVLDPLVAACAAAKCVALVGAPIEGSDGRPHIAVLAVSGAAVSVCYRKVWLGSAEAERFAPGPGPAVLEVDGWRLGLAVCKDTSILAHQRDTAQLGVDVYVAGTAMFPYEVQVQDERGARIARSLGLPVALASFAGPAGGGYNPAAGHSIIFSATGAPMARTGAVAGEIGRATLMPELSPAVTR